MANATLTKPKGGFFSLQVAQLLGQDAASVMRGGLRDGPRGNSTDVGAVAGGVVGAVLLLLALASALIGMGEKRSGRYDLVIPEIRTTTGEFQWTCHARRSHNCQRAMLRSPLSYHNA